MEYKIKPEKDLETGNRNLKELAGKLAVGVLGVASLVSSAGCDKQFVYNNTSNIEELSGPVTVVHIEHLF